jgi:hypothetical protein
MSNQSLGNIPPADPNFQYGTCTGNKKALLLGINYFGERNQLNGCCNDVRNVYDLLTTKYRFPPRQENIVCLTDDQSDYNFIPTRQNIINALYWLSSGAQAGDSLFFHFSGHGGLVDNHTGEEESGKDCCIYPVDHKQAGPIIDDELHYWAASPLPSGVRLTVIFDCCHSGSGMDFPFTYNHDGTLKSYKPQKQIFTDLGKAGMNFLIGRDLAAASSLFSGIKGIVKELTPGKREKIEQVKQKRTTWAECLMFSGCKDDQTSKDTTIQGQNTGAMSHALIKVLDYYQGNCSYLQLLEGMRIELQKYQQKPQLSSGHQMDMNRLFFI